MQYLLDTCAYIAVLDSNDRLSAETKAILLNPANKIFVSAITGAEIAIKSSLGKLRVAADHNLEVTRRGFLHLPVSYEHGYALQELPAHHRDPFDRLLIAQARSEQLTIITSDRIFEAYSVQLQPI